MRDQTKNLLIGIFVVSAIAIITYILLFLHPTTGDRGQILKARFTNIDKVSVGTRVLFAGHPIGEVIDIKEIPDARSPEYLYEDEVYIYELTLRIDSKIEVYTTDIIAIRTSGLLGEKSIAIIPRPAAPGVHLIKVTNQILYSESTGTVEDTFKELTQVGDLLKATLKKVGGVLDEMEKGTVLGKSFTIADNVKSITGSINRPDELKNIVQTTGEAVNSLKYLEPFSDLIFDDVAITQDWQ